MLHRGSQDYMRFSYSCTLLQYHSAAAQVEKGSTELFPCAGSLSERERTFSSPGFCPYTCPLEPGYKLSFLWVCFAPSPWALPMH